jgi:hypothetical protein
MSSKRAKNSETAMDVDVDDTASNADVDVAVSASVVEGSGEESSDSEDSVMIILEEEERGKVPVREAKVQNGAQEQPTTLDEVSVCMCVC